MSATAMVFAPVTAYVEATHVDGAVETIKLDRLSAAEARKTGLERVRYAAFALEGPWCVTRIESFDRTGYRLWRSGDVRAETCTTNG